MCGKGKIQAGSPIHYIITHQPSQLSPFIYCKEIYTQTIRNEGKKPNLLERILPQSYSVLPDSVNSGTLVALPFACGQPGPLNL